MNHFIDLSGFDQPEPADKQKALFERQKHTLDLFLEKKAISQEQYNKSLQTLIEKMGIQDKSQPEYELPQFVRTVQKRLLR